MALLTAQTLSPWSRAFASLRCLSLERYRHFVQLRDIAHCESLFNQTLNSQRYSDDLSYRYELFSLASPAALHRFTPYTDALFGGNSSGSLAYDPVKKQLLLEGQISDQDKDKLTHFPSIGMARRHPYPLNCGPFQGLRVQLEGDGKAVHVGVEIESKISGVISCYGILVSKLEGLRSYELPFANMVLVGGEDNERSHNDYLSRSTGQSGAVFDSNTYDTRRIVMTEMTSVRIRDINFRLLGSRCETRRVGIRSIQLVKRGQSEQFMREYRQPFFFLVGEEPYEVDKQTGVSWLKEGYQTMRTIDLGDKKYHRK